MATRSTIALEKNDGTVEMIYCHWDGYPEYNGNILYNHYNDAEKVAKLLSFGDMSSLHENIEPRNEHSFEKPEDNVCVFYGRDRGEDNCQARKYDKFEHYFDFAERQEYNYILRNDGVWYYFHEYHNNMKPLSSCFETKENVAETLDENEKNFLDELFGTIKRNN